MTRILKAAGAFCAMGVMIFALFFRMAGGLRAETAPDIRQSAESAQETADSQVDQPLFPSLSAEGITAIFVGTPDRSFRFDVDVSGEVSVNGQQADGEIYMTLVDQIAELPVVLTGAFVPDSTQLLLTLTICQNDVEHTACFYEDGGSGETARVVTGSADAPEYGQTNGWRIGTLMMTCEGTRIQDERGNEHPASFSTSKHDQP
ncbi:MAG: hypothetical protein ACI4MM_10510 [Candidatus Ventricola sp.]